MFTTSFATLFTTPFATFVIAEVTGTSGIKRTGTTTAPTKKGHHTTGGDRGPNRGDLADDPIWGPLPPILTIYISKNRGSMAVEAIKSTIDVVSNIFCFLVCDAQLRPAASSHKNRFQSV